MRTATILMTVLLLGAPAWIAAQTAAPATGAPEVFTATANAKNAGGAMSGTLDIRVNRYTPDFDRKTVEEALRLGGYPRFLTTLRNAPEVGQLVLGGSEPYAIRYARERVEAGNRTILVVTDRPVFFVTGGRAVGAKPRAGYEVAMVEIKVDGKGQATGTMAGAARVRPDGGGGVLLDDYADQPITLTNVVRKSMAAAPSAAPPK